MLLHKASLFHVSNHCINTRHSLICFASMIQRVTLSNIISVGPNEEEAQACLRAIFLTDISADRAKLITAKGPRVDGTCEWIKSHALYDSWLRYQSQLLWLCGGPGKGKTMLSIFLAEELEQTATISQNKLFLQYFCDNKDEKRNTAVAVIRGLVSQLLQSHPKLFNHILPTFRTQKESLLSFETQWRIFESMVCDPALETTYCVLDGLDECDEASLEILLGKFAALLSAKPYGSSACHLNLLIVSRDLPDFIPELLSSFPRISLNPDADTEINRDIDLFIKAKVKELSRRKQYPEALRVHVGEVFRDRAQGTFLWIGIVAQALRKYKATEVEKALDLFPPGLDELYARILLQIDSGRREIAARILRWVVMAVRPLRISELSVAIETTVRPSAVAFSRDERTRDQVSNCGYFLKIEEDEVGLIHQSAKDYLLRKTCDSNPELEAFRVKEEVANLEIARKCLNYLHSGALENSESHILKNASHLRAFPLLKYAALHWHEHARWLARSEDIFDLSLPFYRKKSHIRRSWLVAYREYSDNYFRYPLLLESFTLLHLASYFDILPLAEKLVLGKGMMNKIRCLYYLRKRDRYGMTALMWASHCGHEAVVRLLLEKGADINAKDPFGGTALKEAADEGRKTLVRLLLEKGADINAIAGFGEPALITAAGLGLENIVWLLLEKGADINAKDRNEITALMLAVIYGEEAVIRLLLEKGADINAKDKYGETALMNVGGEGYEVVIRLLLEKGADVNIKNKDGETALMKAAGALDERRAETSIRLLLEKGADVKAQDQCGETALMLAVKHLQENVVQLLLEKGADINAKDENGKTALMLAVISEEEAVIPLLLEKEADINAKDKYGKTALMKAAGTWNKRMAETLVRLLLEKGADIKAQDAYGETALTMAVNREYENVIRLLTSAGNS